MFENPDGPTTERWFHAAGCRRWLTVRRDTTTDTVIEVRDDVDARRPHVSSSASRPGPVRWGSSTTLPRWSVGVGIGSGRAFVVTDPGVVAAGVIDRVRGRPRGGTDRVAVYDGVEPNPGTTSILRGSAALARSGLDVTAIVAGRRRVGDGFGQGDLAPRRQRRACPRTRLHRDDWGRAARSSPCRRPPGPGPRRTPSASSPTRRPGGRATSVTRPSCPPGRSSTRR